MSAQPRSQLHETHGPTATPLALLGAGLCVQDWRCEEEEARAASSRRSQSGGESGSKLITV